LINSFGLYNFFSAVRNFLKKNANMPISGV